MTVNIRVRDDYSRDSPYPQGWSATFNGKVTVPEHGEGFTFMEEMAKAIAQRLRAKHPMQPYQVKVDKDEDNGMILMYLRRMLGY